MFFFSTLKQEPSLSSFSLFKRVWNRGKENPQLEKVGCKIIMVKTNVVNSIPITCTTVTVSLRRQNYNEKIN